MKNFWKQLAVNAMIRALSGVFIWLTAKGYITSGQGEAVALTVATVVVNVGQAVINRLLSRWHIDLGRLVADGTSRKELAEISSTVSPITKLIEAATPGANPSAIEAATIAENRTPKEPS